MDIVQIATNLLKDIRLAGFLDIVFVSVFIYMTLVLFKQSKARFIITGVLIICIVYLVAQQLNLILTTSILQAFFAVILVALIVIFQEEIRRFFEHLAIWGLHPKIRAKKTYDPNEKDIEILQDTLTDLANEKIGALIVIKGKTDVSGHLEGGQNIEGILSEPLLKSIFDPHSSGHDGAVLVEKGRVKVFGTHLPLSNNFSQLKDRGTRHSAALGLSEVTDALCVVVSEERGTVSFARNGELKQIGLEQLKLSLENYYNEIYPPDNKKYQLNLFSNYKEKFISVLMAVILWFVFVHQSKLMYRSFEVPIEHVTLPSGLEVRDINPDHLKVTFAGSRKDFYFVNGNKIKLLLKISDPKIGTERVVISESNIDFPKSVSLENFEPKTVTVRIENKVSTRKQSGISEK